MSFESIRKMEIRVGDLELMESDVTVLGLHEKAPLEGPAAALDRATNGQVAKALATGDFKGELNEVLVVYPMQGPARRILVVGLGKGDEFTGEKIRAAAATAARRARDLGANQAAAFLFGKRTPVSLEDAAQAFAEGALMGSYQYLAYRTKDLEKIKVLERLVLLVPDQAFFTQAKAAFDRGVSVAGAVNYARTLASHPGNYATPSFLAAEAQRIASDPARRLRCTVFDRAKMVELGMGGSSASRRVRTSRLVSSCLSTTAEIPRLPPLPSWGRG